MKENVRVKTRKEDIGEKKRVKPCGRQRKEERKV